MVPVQIRGTAVAGAGIAPITAGYLGDVFSAEHWRTAETVTAACRSTSWGPFR